MGGGGGQPTGNLTFSGFQCRFSYRWVSIVSQIPTPGDHRRNDRHLKTFIQYVGRVKFPTQGTVVDVKIPSHVRLTKSNSRGLPHPPPPILGQTTDRCIIYLSTTSGSISTRIGRIDNVSIDDYEMALSTCPERRVSLPLFTTNAMSYVQWKPDSQDATTLQLQHQSLTQCSSWNDHQPLQSQRTLRHVSVLRWSSAALQKVDALVDQMNETTEDSLSIHLTYAAFAQSVLNSVATVIGCKCIYNLRHNQL